MTPDETGWRVGGRPAWLHAFVSPRATAYEIDPTRGHKPAKQLSGSIGRARLCTMAGVFTVGSGSVSSTMRASLAASVPSPARNVRAWRRTFAPCRAGAHRSGVCLASAWRGHRLNRDDLAMQGLASSCELEQFASGRFTYKPNRRLANHILKHAMHWFWFLIDPTIAATNYRAEQAIRPAVVNRKVWGGNRTWPGAQAQGILMSVIRTCEQRDRRPLRLPDQCPLPPSTATHPRVTR